MAIRSEQIQVENDKLIIGTTVNSVPNVGVAMSAGPSSQITFAVDGTDIKLELKDGTVHGSETAVVGQNSQIEAASIGSADIATSGVDTTNIADDAVNADKILGADGAAAIVTYDFSGVTAFSVPEPTSPSHAATKKYVDDFAQGLDFKDSVKYATTADLSATYDSGTMTLTANANGTLVVDSYSPSAGDRILVKNQSSASENGIYVVTDTGSVSSDFVLTRSSDFNENDEVGAGSYVLVTSGATNSLNAYVVQSVGGSDPILDTDNINWSLFSGSATAVNGSDGITVSGTTISVNKATTSGLEFVAGALAVDTDDQTITLGGTNNNELVIKIAGTTLTPSLEYDSTSGSDGLRVKLGSSMSVGVDGIDAAILASSEDLTSQQAVTTNTGSTGIELTRVPVSGADVYIYVNGVMQTVGDGTVVGADFFFMPSGSTNTADVRAFVDLVVGDVLWFSPGNAGFNFATTDKVKIVFSSVAP